MVYGVLCCKILPHFRFQGSITSFHNTSFLFTFCGEKFDDTIFQELLKNTILELCSNISLYECWFLIARQKSFECRYKSSTSLVFEWDGLGIFGENNYASKQISKTIIVLFC